MHPIGAHRLLGDGRSTALVTPDGIVDWWCAPRMDSPPLLWSLLDPKGAEAAWVGGSMVADTGPTAGPATHGTLRIDGRRIRRWDGLVVIAGGSCLVRMLQAEAGEVRATHRISLGGFDQGWGRAADGGFDLPGVAVQLASSGSSEAGDTEITTSVHVSAHQWTGLVVAVGTTRPVRIEEAVHELEEAIARQEHRFRSARLPKHHPERAREALAVLDTCTYEPTGAVVASVTTSLPEAPGFDRQFDYRYSWLRDAALATSVASLLGDSVAARRHLGFLHTLAGDDGCLDRPVVTVVGGDVPEEREVPGVAGWEGSLPVRVGNGAAAQVQYDAWGIVAEAVSVHLQTGGRLDDQTWGSIRSLADRVVAEDVAPSHGIWEFRRPADLVSGEIGRWLVLDRAIWISRGWRPTARRRRWIRERRRIRDRILGAIDADGGLPQVFGGPPRADASALLVVLFGLLSPNDVRAPRLVHATVAALDAGPFLYRYPPGGDDGFDGFEGTFVPVAWWAAACFAVIGDVEEARRRVDELCLRLPPLLSEEVAAVDGRPLGNVPLVWSHMELARTLYLLDAAEIRRRFGAAGLWTWRLTRFVSMRRQSERHRRAAAHHDNSSPNEGAT